MNHPGSLLAGRYRLSARIATGGMGDVWAATDELLDRQVAAKLVKPEFAGDPIFRKRLHAEAKAAAAVRNPHVVDVFDVGQDTDDDGHPLSFVIMELLPGQSLTAVMAAGPLTAPDTADLMAQVGDALATAHARGVVHRDIKPANLMRDANGHITVLDFGIARAADTSAMTATGMMLGTARYISPEQVDGKPATPASDVYSLGVVAYHCLVGQPPFDAGSDIATALAHRDQPPPPLPASVPPDLAGLIERCLAKQPGDRPAAAAVAHAASALAVARPVSAATAVMPVTAVTTPSPAATPPAPLPAAETAALPVAPAASTGISQWLEWRRLTAMAAAGVLILGLITIIGIASQSSGPATASAGTGPAAPRVQPAANSAKPKVVVRPGRYIGERYGAARRQLHELGLMTRESGASQRPAARVTAVSPIGRVTAGRTITLTVLPAVSGPAHPKPAAPGKPPAPHHAKPKPPKPPKPGHAAKPIPPGHAKHEAGHGAGHGPGADD